MALKRLYNGFKMALFGRKKKMAMVIRSAKYPEMEGKMGGNVYRLDQSKQHIQKYPRIINKEPSVKQIKVRRAFSYLIHRYNNIITLEQHATWINYAFTHRKKSRKGHYYFITGSQWYLHFNIPLWIDDKPLIDEAPV